MSSYPLNNTSIAYNDLKQNLIDFVETKPTEDRWRDFFTGSEGVIILELIAGLGFYEAMKIIFTREESYLAYTNTLQSARAIASTLTYSSFRGRNRRYNITIIPEVSAALPAFSIIGSQEDYDLVTLEPVILTAGTSNTFNVAVGTLKSIELRVPSSDLSIFRFNEDLVSTDFCLYLNNTVVPTTDSLLEALKDKYLVQTNAVGGVNVTYLNTTSAFTHKYATGDILKLDYIQFQNIEYSTELSCSYAASVTINKTEITEDPETIESIQTKAPIAYETQQLIRSREDYVSYFQKMRSKFVDTDGRDLSPAYMELVYEQNSGLILSDTEKTTIRAELDYKRFFGIPLPYICDPVLYRPSWTISLKLNTNISATLLQPLVDSVLKKYENVMSSTIDFSEVEKALESLESVQIARITPVVSTAGTSDFYTQGSLLSNSELVYSVTGITYISQEIEPTWNYTVGSLTSETNIIWEAIPKSGNPETWTASAHYSLYDVVVPSTPGTETGKMFRLVKGKSISDPVTEPTWGEVAGEILEDNQLIWKTLEVNATAPAWLQSHWYNLGDVIKSTDGKISAQVIGYRRKPTTNPDFSAGTNQLSWDDLILRKEDFSNPLDSKYKLPWGSYADIDYTLILS